MSQELHRDPTDRFNAGLILVCGYDELTRVDRALRDAEQRLKTAHAMCGEHGPSHAQEVYQEVVALRDRTRQVLAVLGEIWVADH